MSAKERLQAALRAGLVALALAVPVDVRAAGAGGSASPPEHPALSLDGPLPDVLIALDFDGAAVTVRGRVAGGPPEGDRAGLSIVVLGEPRPAVVFRKERRFGLWMNADRRRFEGAPVFFAAAQAGALWPGGADALDWAGPARAVERSQPGPTEPFRRALARLRAAEGRYQTEPAPIRFQPDGRFAATIRLPASLLEGEHRVIAALIEDGVVRARASRRFIARKSGVEAWVDRASREYPAFYGVAILLLAAAAAWGADRMFRPIIARRARRIAGART